LKEIATRSLKKSFLGYKTDKYLGEGTHPQKAVRILINTSFQKEVLLKTEKKKKVTALKSLTYLSKI
jgi:hypothetical protein